MKPIEPRAVGRNLALALAGAFIVSACTTSAAETGAIIRGTAAPEDGTFTTVGLVTPARTPRSSPRTDLPPAVQSQDGLDSKPREPIVTTIKLRPRPGPGPFSMDLYERGDFMHQQTKDWCAAGAAQTMMNIIDPGEPNRSASFQRRLYIQGRQLSHNRKKLGSIGMDLTGWMELLNTHGYGPYEVDSGATRVAAIRKAARAIRMTGKPAGLVTWRGAHAWVMSGFTATADPAYTPDFEVRSVFIQDVWYPYVSTIWGASRPPGAAVPLLALAEDYLPYRRPSAPYPKRDGRFMLILPVLPPDTVVR